MRETACRPVFQKGAILRAGQWGEVRSAIERRVAYSVFVDRAIERGGPPEETHR